MDENQELTNMMKEDKQFIAVHEIMQLKNKVNEISSMKEHAIKKVHEILPDDRISIVEARAAALDPEKIKNLDMRKKEDWEQVKEIYTMEDGGCMTFATNPNTDEIKVREMHKDFLIYLHTLKVESDKFDKIDKEYNQSVDEIMSQLEEIIGKEEADKINNYTTFTEYYRDWITKNLSKEDISPEIRKLLQKTLDADVRGITLDFLKSNIIKVKETSGLKSLLWGFRKNYEAYANQARKIMSSRFEKYKYHISFNKFKDFESIVFPDIPKEYNNLTMYLLFRFIRANKDTLDKYWMITIGEFLTQMGFMLKTERPESSKLFEENLRELLNLIIKK